MATASKHETLKKRLVIKEDGRKLFFFTFDDKPTQKQSSSEPSAQTNGSKPNV